MVHLVARDNAGNRRWVNLNGPQFQQLRQARSVENTAAQSEWNLTTTEGDLPKTSRRYISLPTLSTFWSAHAAGRGLLPSDAPEGQDPENVAVLGYQFWQRHYNGDPGIVGKKIQLVRKSYVIVA